MNARLLVLVLVLVPVLGCREKTRGVASERPAIDASPLVSAAVASASPPPPPSDPIVDLLHTVDCTVAVSSKVENPHDFPEHLVDGKPETAWNSKTGDLNGFIEFRVPASARVTRVELTAGFDKVGPKGDLFAMNHRITKVRLSRGGTVVKEVDLDPSKRSLQAIDVDEPGGDFRLDVLATQPGTEKAWRELAVSELRVWGRAGGAPENPAHLPKVAIGALDGTRSHAKPAKTDPAPVGPFGTIEDLCKTYDRVMTPLIDLAFPGDRYPGKIEGPHCAEDTVAAATATIAQGPFKSARFVRFDGVEEQRSLLVLETASGFSRTNVELWSRFHDDPGCLHGSHHEVEDARLVQTSTGQDVVIVRVLDRDVRWAQLDPTLQGLTTTERAYACRVDAKGAATCDGPLITARAHQGFPSGMVDPSDARLYVIDVTKTPWTSRREPSLGPAGDLRLAP
ncbi:MAG: hypothetical protein KIT84_07375 [Labilithrix sp.]|nr:hypothetical protein [Labilithrix sp.]MCW5810816.1 hypothetical protein [Labilithrix sp.]